MHSIGHTHCTYQVNSHIFACNGIYDRSWNFLLLFIECEWRLVVYSRIWLHWKRQHMPTNQFPHSHTQIIFTNSASEKRKVTAGVCGKVALCAHLARDHCRDLDVFIIMTITNLHFEWWWEIYWSSCISPLQRLRAAAHSHADTFKKVYLFQPGSNIWHHHYLIFAIDIFLAGGGWLVIERMTAHIRIYIFNLAQFKTWLFNIVVLVLKWQYTILSIIDFRHIPTQLTHTHMHIKRLFSI